MVEIVVEPEPDVYELMLKRATDICLAVGVLRAISAMKEVLDTIQSETIEKAWLYRQLERTEAEIQEKLRREVLCKPEEER